MNIENTTKKPYRSLEFDILKGLAIFLVLCGHSIMDFSSADKNDNSLYVFICSFHMPLFMLMSGFFSASTLNLPIKEIINKKFWQLIYPTVTFGIIYLIVNILVMGEPVRDSLSFFLVGFWFLKSCFLCFIILGICLKITPGKKLIGCLIALILSQCLPFFKMTYMLPFFVMGYLLSTNRKFLYQNTGIVFLFSLILYGSGFLYYSQSDLRDISLVALKNSLLSGSLYMLQDYAIMQLMRFFLGFTGSLTIMCGVIWIVNRFKIKSDITGFSTYGKYTLGIYVLQTIILEQILIRFVDLSGLHIYLFSYLIVPLFSLLIMDICFYLIRGITLLSMKKYLFDGFPEIHSDQNIKLTA